MGLPFLPTFLLLSVRTPILVMNYPISLELQIEPYNNTESLT
jgi:hypothetical protein